MGIPISSTASFLADGSWERDGRNPATAATVGLIGIGVLYFNAQSLLAIIAVFIVNLTNGIPRTTGNVVRQLLDTIRALADPLRVAVVISQYAFLLLPAFLLVRRWHSSQVLRYVRFRSASLREIGLAVLATLAVIPAANFIADELVRRLGIPPELMQANAELFTARSLPEFLWIVFVVCLTPALCEEIFFRGFVQRTFERAMRWKSVVLVGVLFGLFHFNPLGLISLSALGILFGYFFYRSQSLIPPMAAHFANNFVAVVFLFRAATAGETGPDTPGWLAAVLLPFAAGLLFFYHRITRRSWVPDTT